MAQSCFSRHDKSSDNHFLKKKSKCDLHPNWSHMSGEVKVGHNAYHSIRGQETKHFLWFKNDRQQSSFSTGVIIWAGSRIRHHHVYLVATNRYSPPPLKNKIFTSRPFWSRRSEATFKNKTKKLTAAIILFLYIAATFCSR